MATYRAAYFVATTGQDTVLTLPEHAHMADGDLLEEALKFAMAADLIDLDETDEEAAWPRLTRAQFDAGVEVGEWKE